MAYVIAEPCVATCDQSCLKVCPMDCIHGPIPERTIESTPPAERKLRLASVQLYIDPEVCISCGACEPECPVEAIFDEDDLPSAWSHYAEINAAFFKR